MVKITQDFGTVEPPPGVEQFDGGDLSGLPMFISIILRTMIVFAGLYTLLNIILAGYDYLSADGDVQKIKNAGSRIFRSIWGLFVAAGAFLIAALIGWVIFNDPDAILEVRIFGP